METASYTDIMNTVRRQVARLTEDAGIGFDDIKPESSLVDDLGLDSLRFVDLTLALEDELQITEFPMQEWVDSQATRETRALTVESLTQACVSVLARGATS